MIDKTLCETKNDEQLVQLSLQDSGWYLCLMQKYETRLFWYLKRISSLSDEDLEDELQEIFLKVYRHLRDYDYSLKFSSWIYRIAHNFAISNYRKLKARPQTVTGEEGEKILANIIDEKNPEEEIYKNIRHEELTKVIGQLPPKFHQAIVLRYLEGKDYREISDIMKAPTGTVATLISRAKKNLAALIKKNNIEL